jgi:uncharacterized membrane protein
MQQEWHLKRNCSLTPRQAMLAFGSLCALTLLIGTGFALLGAWPMFGFAWLDVICIALALRHYTRHATDHEYVRLVDGSLLIERVEAGTVERIRLDSSWARVALPDRPRALIRVEARGVQVELGRFVSEEARRQVGAELRRALRAGSCLA